MKCHNCGKELNKGERYCSFCGNDNSLENIDNEKKYSNYNLSNIQVSDVISYDINKGILLRKKMIINEILFSIISFLIIIFLIIILNNISGYDIGIFIFLVLIIWVVILIVSIIAFVVNYTSSIELDEIYYNNIYIITKDKRLFFLNISCDDDLKIKDLYSKRDVNEIFKELIIKTYESSIYYKHSEAFFKYYYFICDIEVKDLHEIVNIYNINSNNKCFSIINDYYDYINKELNEKNKLKISRVYYKESILIDVLNSIKVEHR